MKRGKVFGGIVMRGGKQWRAVVYEASQVRAAKIVNSPLYDFRRFWSVTGNAEEIAAAKKHPGTLVRMREI